MKARSILLRRHLLLGTALAAIGAVGGGVAAFAERELTVLVRGGGSTFAAPIFCVWTKAFRSKVPSVEINYDVIGSGEGISRFVSGSLDFAATDAPLTPEEEAQVNGGVLHVPVIAGMVAVAYNLPGDLQGQLRLPRDVFGDIFAGRITNWNNPRITAANPHLALPKRTIHVVGRLDRSGTTYAFTKHLNATNKSWMNSGAGASTRVNWPGGAILRRGNEGVAVNILRGDGTIGYVEYGFASRLGLPMAVLENAAGTFVTATPAHGQAAIASANVSEDLKIEMPDPPGTDSYPVVTFTWSLLHRSVENEERQRVARTFTEWALTEGQSYAQKLGYVPLSDVIQERARLAMAEIAPAVASPAAKLPVDRP